MPETIEQLLALLLILALVERAVVVAFHRFEHAAWRRCSVCHRRRALCKLAWTGRERAGSDVV